MKPEPYSPIPSPNAVLERFMRAMFTQIITALARSLRTQNLSVAEIAALHLIDREKMLRVSDLVTALPVEAVSSYVQARQLTVLPLELGVGMESFGIIRRRGHLLSPAAERVLEALRATAQRLYASDRE